MKIAALSPAQLSALLGALPGAAAGGLAGSLFSSRDPETGETHRGRNALIGMGVGATLGAGTGLAAKEVGDQIASVTTPPSISDALFRKDRTFLQRVLGMPPSVREAVTGGAGEEALEHLKRTFKGGSVHPDIGLRIRLLTEALDRPPTPQELINGI
jgi:hypothetical protein